MFGTNCASAHQKLDSGFGFSGGDYFFTHKHTVAGRHGPGALGQAGHFAGAAHSAALR